LLNKIQIKLVKYLTNAALLIKSPYLLAYSFIIENIIFNKNEIDKLGKNIVFLSGPVVDYEIQHLKRIKGINYLPLSLRTVKDTMIKVFYNYSNDINDYNYWHKIQYYKESRLSLYYFWYRYLFLLKSKNMCQGVLSRNFIYSHQIELNRACIKLKIPFIVLYAEAIAPVAQLEMNIIKTKTHKNVKFMGTNLLHYNSHGNRIYQNVKGVTPENSLTVGFPRSDVLFDHLKNADFKEKDQATLFYSAPINKKRLFPEEMWSRLNIQEKLDDFYQIFLETAQLYNDYSFQIKFKRKNEHYKLFNMMVQKRNLIVPKNVKFILGGDPLNLILSSKFIFGFNSTVLLESLILNKIIIEPSIITENDDLPFSYLGEYPGITNYVDTKEQVFQLFNQRNDYKINKISRNQALKHYLFYIDGKSSNRVNSAINNIT